MKKTEELFTYFVQEREQIRIYKEQGEIKPWTEDKILQSVYFCNVRREDDKVTQFVRQWVEENWKGQPKHLLAYLVLARTFNLPSTLEAITWYKNWTPTSNINVVKKLRDKDHQIFNGAYLISTCGKAMDKVDYVFNLASDVYHTVDPRDTCELQWEDLQWVNGLGSFLAAQIVADIKNTERSWLEQAPDWNTFAAIGPGSQRGLNYLFMRRPDQPIKRSQFLEELSYVRTLLPEVAEDICNQDLQNCLCEYSKYMRVRDGGRTKRNYPGHS